MTWPHCLFSSWVFWLSQLKLKVGTAYPIIMMMFWRKQSLFRCSWWFSHTKFLFFPKLLLCHGEAVLVLSKILLLTGIGFCDTAADQRPLRKGNSYWDETSVPTENNRITAGHDLATASNTGATTENDLTTTSFNPAASGIKPETADDK